MHGNPPSRPEGRPGRLVVTLALALVSATAHAQGWMVTDPMTDARFAPGATLLPSGRVLVAGGSGTVAELTSAEIYDPMQAPGLKWSAAASLPTAHRFRMITLGNGLALFVGEDRGPMVTMATAHVFDESTGATGAWQVTSNLSALVRYRATLTELASGMVLYCGGYDGTGVGPTYDSAELYDPVANQWQPTGTMLGLRAGHTAVLLQTGPDAGRVLVTGGFVRVPLQQVVTSEFYDPPTGVWLAAPPMATARSGPTATVLVDGRVLVAGGRQSLGTLEASAELYDPLTGAWSPTGSMTNARVFHTETLLLDGRVLVTGGEASGALVQATAEVYDPASGTWSSAGSMADGRSHHRATLLPSGDVLVAGGLDLAGAFLATAETYQPPCGICGDAIGDGVVSIVDALLAARHAAGLLTLTGCEFERANVIGILFPLPGAVVDSLDVLRIAQFSVGLSVTLTCR